VAYSDPNFSFNPVKQNSLNTSNAKNVSTVPSPIGINDNPYIPTCSNQSTLQIETYAKQVSEYAANFGMQITYWPRIYQYDKANFVFGEDNISGFHLSRGVKAIVNFTSYTTFLTKFGIMSDSDITIYIPIADFEKVWGPSMNGVLGDGVYPLAGDIFIINDSACNRPLRQTPMAFEITDVSDKINTVDFLGGYYTWKLTAKRYDYSYEKNGVEERYLDDETSDQGVFGRLPGGDNIADLSGKEYSADAAAKKIFDLPRSKKNIYGEEI